jgi:hypothetical protein
VNMTTELPDLVLGSEIDPDDPVKTHVIKCPPDREDAEAWVTEARIMGWVVIALCGHQWIPQRDPSRHPLCDKCVEQAKAHLS